MHEAALAQAALPAPTVCLGLRLQPYSLGHELFLIREQNPLADRSATGELKNLCEAVLICCQSFAQNRSMHRDMFIGFKLALWRRRVRKMLFIQELVTFKDYQTLGSLQFPPSGLTKPNKSGGAPSRLAGAPFLLRLQQFLVVQLGKTEAEAWDYPFGLAKMQYQSFCESEERLEIYNAHDAEFDRYVEEQEAAAAVAAKGGQSCPA